MLAAGEQAPRLVQSRLNAELMRREPEHRLELTDEVKRGDPDRFRHVLDEQRRVGHFDEQVARPAEPPERVVS